MCRSQQIHECKRPFSISGTAQPFSAHPHIRTSAHPHIRTSAHPHIRTSAHPHIRTSAHPHIRTSAHLHICTSAHLHIRTSAHQPLNASTAFLTLPYFFKRLPAVCSSRPVSFITIRVPRSINLSLVSCMSTILLPLTLPSCIITLVLNMFNTNFWA